MSTFSVSNTSFSSSPLSSVVVHNNSSAKQNAIRNTVKPPASIWRDQFLTNDETKDLAMEKQVIEELKEEVRKELMIKASNDSMQHMKLIELIDVVQRLGIAYHFEVEIEKALQHIYVTYGEQWVHNNNLHSISVWFRLLRQQGFNISSGIFANHMDEKGNFRESLCTDAQGMLALYEAAYMRVEGEQVLDEALKFTKIHLDNIAKDPCCDSFLRTSIQQALKQPLRKRLPRLEAVRYIPIYQKEVSHNEFLLKLAKLDFNMIQSMHKKELSQICKWWKDLDMQNNKLPYVRDTVVEGSFWIMGVYPEPQHARLRMFLIKTCMWLVVMDDTFDNYGTLDELEIFTEAVERWSISCLDVLPEYMKLIYQELLNMHSEMEESIKKEGKSYHMHYDKEMTKEYIRSILVEAKWLKSGYKPTLEEYISNSLVSVSYPLMIAKSYVGGGDLVTEETFKWVATNPPIAKASSLIFRYMNDIATHKEEQERGHVASSIECYQKEFGATEDEARQFFSNQVEEEWKVINRESLRPTHVPFPLLTPVIDLARVCDVLYKDNDNFKHPGEEMINHIKSLFVNPMVI